MGKIHTVNFKLNEDKLDHKKIIDALNDAKHKDGGKSRFIKDLILEHIEKAEKKPPQIENRVKKINGFD